jgi:hypothetical protein
MDVPDSLYRQIKARAALRGQTVRAFLLEAIRDKLASSRSPGKVPRGWRSVFGKAEQKDIDELQQLLDTEFARVDPDEWR